MKCKRQVLQNLLVSKRNLYEIHQENGGENVSKVDVATSET